MEAGSSLLQNFPSPLQILTNSLTYHKAGKRRRRRGGGERGGEERGEEDKKRRPLKIINLVLACIVIITFCIGCNIFLSIFFRVEFEKNLIEFSKMQYPLIDLLCSGDRVPNAAPSHLTSGRKHQHWDLRIEIFKINMFSNNYI